MGLSFCYDEAKLGVAPPDTLGGRRTLESVSENCIRVPKTM